MDKFEMLREDEMLDTVGGIDPFTLVVGVIASIGAAATVYGQVREMVKDAGRVAGMNS